MNSCLEAFKNGIMVVPIRHNHIWGKEELFIKPGVRYDPDLTPFFIEIMMACSYDSPTQQITIVGSPQTGKTSAIIQVDIAQKMHQTPDNMIYAAPNGSFANKFSKSKIDPMINNTPCLKNLVSDSSSRDGGNTILAKQYPGGTLYIITSGSTSDWRMIDCDRVYLDDFDAHPKEIKGEGSKKKTAEKRMASKGDRGKLIIASSPVDMANSKIWPEFLAGSQEYYYVPCPFCTVKQVLKWENFKYDDGDINSIRLKCINENCGKLIEEKHKTWMLENGEWRAHNPNRQNKLHRSFHLSAFYAPVSFLSWTKICQDWFDCKGNKSQTQAFRQMVEAIPYEEPDEEQTPIEEILSRRYKFSHQVPKEVLLLTGFCDMQNNRLEAFVWGWGLNDQCWRIDKEVFYAPEGRRIDHKIVWDQLEIFRKKVYIHESGAEIGISAFGVDTGGGYDGDGHYSEQAYNFVRGKFAERCFATKGSSMPGAPLYSRSKNQNKGRVPLYMIGTDSVKRTLFGRLRAKNKLETGYVNLPDFMTDEECHQLLSEKLQVVRQKNSKGDFENIKKWKKIRERNEEWDGFCGSYAVMRIINPNFVALQQLFLVENEGNNLESTENINKSENLLDKEKNDELKIIVVEDNQHVARDEERRRETFNALLKKRQGGGIRNW